MIAASRVPRLGVVFPAYNDGGTIGSLAIQAVAIASGTVVSAGWPYRCTVTIARVRAGARAAAQR